MEITDDIIIRVFEGDASKEEVDALRRWLEGGEERRRHFLSLREKWNVIAGPVLSAEEEAVAWKHIRGFMRRGRRRRLWRAAFKYAAAVVVLVAIPFAIWQSVDGWHGGGTPVGENMPIVPGSFRAVLTTASGDKVELNPEDLRRIDVGSRGKATNGAGGLVYTRQERVAVAEYNTVRTPFGGEYTVELEDGTKVYMNSGSTLRYPVVFNDSVREVYFSGEAYFEVRTDSTRRFVAHVDAVDLQVYGTSFNVNSFGGIEAVLVSGSVGVLGKDGLEHRLKPSQLIEYDSVGRFVHVEDVDPQVYLAWKNGYFFFDDKSLEEVLATLGRWYDVEFSYAPAELRDMHFTGHTEKYEDINVILNAIEKIVDVRFEINGRTITVKKQVEISSRPPRM